MASIFKRKYTKLIDSKRVKKQSQCWYVKYRDADGIERRVRAYKDKEASRQLAARLEKEAELAKAGVVDSYKEHRKRPLPEHLGDEIDTVGYYLIPKVCRKLGIPVPKTDKIIEALGQKDISISRTHFHPQGLKVGADVEKLKKVLKRLSP